MVETEDPEETRGVEAAREAATEEVIEEVIEAATEEVIEGARKAIDRADLDPCFTERAAIVEEVV